MGDAFDFNPDRPAFWQHAACRSSDPDVFFTSRGEDAHEAKAICATCVVRPACLEYALTERIKHGVWGGKSEKDRRQMRRVRRLSVTSVVSAGEHATVLRLNPPQRDGVWEFTA